MGAYCSTHERSTQVPPDELGPGDRPLEYGRGPEAAPESGSTVLIIGGGPYGLHMATLLKKRGILTVVLEQKDRLGGFIVHRRR